jgi:hypothetical protein
VVTCSCIYPKQKHAVPSLRATRILIYEDTLLCVHNDIVERHAVDAQELMRPCVGTTPQAPEHIPALDADLLKNFLVTIKQPVDLIRSLEVLVVRGDMSPVVAKLIQKRTMFLGLTRDSRSRRGVERRAQRRPRQGRRDFQRPMPAPAQREPANAPVKLTLPSHHDA